MTRSIRPDDPNPYEMWGLGLLAIAIVIAILVQAGCHFHALTIQPCRDRQPTTQPVEDQSFLDIVGENL